MSNSATLNAVDLSQIADYLQTMALSAVTKELKSCRICTDRFAQTATAHTPRPVIWFQSGARILVAGQAPGARVHASCKPFTDPSGDRLRDWMGIDEATFYDMSQVAIVPMAFCFPGYNAKGSDLPPPKICANTWRAKIMDHLTDIRLTLLIGGYAQAWHLPKGTYRNVTDTVTAWRDHFPGTIALPHPSWRNTAWLKKNPWFEADLLPILKRRVAEALA